MTANGHIPGRAPGGVLAELLLIIAEPVAPGGRDELDDDRGEVLLWVGEPSQSRPDRAVTTSSIFTDGEILLV